MPSIGARDKVIINMTTISNTSNEQSLEAIASLMSVTQKHLKEARGARGEGAALIPLLVQSHL